MNPTHASRPSRVLVVDDDEIIRVVLDDMLRALGIDDIHLAADGHAAMQLLRTMRPLPDLVISDVFMPDMDGIELLTQMAARGFRGRVIIVSGKDAQMLTTSSVIARASGLNVLGALTKPVSPEQLANLLGLPPAA